MTSPSPRSIIRSAAATDQFLRSEPLGIPTHALAQAEAAGEIIRVINGIYIGAPWVLTNLSEAAAWTVRHPGAVAGLLTAAVHHGLTDSFERGTWLCVPIGTSVPRSRTSVVHPVQVTPRSLDSDEANGIERVALHGVNLRITGPDRTVIDLWRYPRWVADEHALTALRRRVGASDFRLPAFARLAQSLDAWVRLEPVLRGMLA